jgi:hypothetical protein
MINELFHAGEGETKLLGVPALPTKSGEPMGHLISKASFELLLNWGCTECVAAMVFDTTAANTGKCQ